MALRLSQFSGASPVRSGFAGGGLFLFLATSPAMAMDELPRVTLAAPREYGYVMGDLIEHTLTIGVPPSSALEPGSLPGPGALDEWLEVRSVEWTREPGQAEASYRIRIVYQVFRGVRAVEQAVTPGFPLRFAGGHPLEVQAPEWAFTLNPLIPPDLADENVTIREALPPRPMGMAGRWRRFGIYLVGSAVLAGYLVWQGLGRNRRARPFGRAHEGLKTLLRGPASPGAHRSAVRLLHRALNETAGETLFAEDLDRFCARYPAFAEARDELAGFFALSRRLFFTAPEAPAPADFPAARLEALCRRCAAAERRRA